MNQSKKWANGPLGHYLIQLFSSESYFEALWASAMIHIRAQGASFVLAFIIFRWWTGQAVYAENQTSQQHFGTISNITKSTVYQ